MLAEQVNPASNRQNRAGDRYEDHNLCVIFDRKHPGVSPAPCAPRPLCAVTAVLVLVTARATPIAPVTLARSAPGEVSRRDLLLSVGRRPRLAGLYTEVEQVRGDSFRADWCITDLIRHAATCGAPDSGVVCPDDGTEFTALQKQVRGP